MYRCNDCGALFEDAKIIINESYGFLADTATVCPACWSDDFEEVVECQMCGEYYPERELINGMCEDCIEEYGFDDEEETAVDSFVINVYPCDLNASGECPKDFCDCKNCVPYPIEYEEKERSTCAS